MSALSSFIQTNQDGSGLGRMAVIMTAFGNELADEMTDLDEMKTRLIMAQTGEVIAWIGHGDNSRLPDIVRDFAESIQPSPVEVTIDNTNTDTSSPEPIDAATR
jgi:hypothetical protein